MKTMLSLRKRYYLKMVGIFLLIAAILIVGVVSCEGEGETYNLTMAVNPVGAGTATDVTDDSPYAAGTVVTIQATANPGYQFANWTGPLGTNFIGSDEALSAVIMPAYDVTVIANFVAVYDLTMAVSPAAGGTATDLTGGSPYKEGTNVDLLAVPATGYDLVGWTVLEATGPVLPAGSFSDANAARTTFTIPARNVTVTAHFMRPLDHFEGYEAEGTLVDETVLLEDQFHIVPFEAYVESAWFFSNPTEKLHDEKVTPILNQDYHLTIYNILWEATSWSWGVDIYNQFGVQYLWVSEPVCLAVPTQKLEPGSHGPPIGLDHFLLYPVITGTPIGVVVSLNDQFHEEPEVWVLEPVYFANPVQKTHGGIVTPIEDPEAHLVFYAISGGNFTGSVVVENQFSLDSQELDVYDPVFLAVPSLKLQVHDPKIEEI